MDERNRQWLQDNCPPEAGQAISLLGSWAGVGDIPDPYYGSLAGFEQVLGLLHRSLQGFVPHLFAHLDQRR